MDKPGKSRDFYHTSYALSGLSVAQNFDWRGTTETNVRLIGSEQNQTVCIAYYHQNNAAFYRIFLFIFQLPTHPLFNVCTDSAFNASEYFNKLPVPSAN